MQTRPHTKVSQNFENNAIWCLFSNGFTLLLFIGAVKLIQSSYSKSFNVSYVVFFSGCLLLQVFVVMFSSQVLPLLLAGTLWCLGLIYIFVPMFWGYTKPKKCSQLFRIFDETYWMMVQKSGHHQLRFIYQYLRGFIHPMWWSPDFWIISSITYHPLESRSLPVGCSFVFLEGNQFRLDAEILWRFSMLGVSVSWMFVWSAQI